MTTVCKALDTNLAHLAWSLWTELGVAGFESKHQDCSIAPEELLILTSVLLEFDPRLRDEALDWCSKYHHFISPIRLQILAKKYKEWVAEPFSTFTSTINAATDFRTKWFVLKTVSPLKFRPSGKSRLQGFDALSMIHFRIRSFLGVSARADVLAFVVSTESQDFSVSDLLEIGFSKRRLADILDDFAAAGIFSKSQVRNQLRYSFVRRKQFIALLGGIPKNMIHWHRILSVILPIRACLQDVQDFSLGVRVIDMSNLLHTLSGQLVKLKLKPPAIQKDLEAYWNSITRWILDFSSSLSQGKFTASQRDWRFG